jgi:hypothetical protein
VLVIDSVMVRVGLAGLVAVGLLLGCDAEAHIRLFDPTAPSGPASGMDASRPPGPEAGFEPTPPPEAGPAPRDAEPPDPLPDRAPPRRDGGRPPVTVPEPEAGVPVGPTRDALLLHYDFSGEGEVVTDLVGDADGLLKNGVQRSAERDYVFFNGRDGYVDMPNGIISGLHSATIVAWVQWEGGPCWQRIFDFGVSDAGEDAAGDAVTSLFMTPQACGFAYFTAMAELDRLQYPVSDNEMLPTGYAVQVALVVDGDRQTFTLYRDEQQVGTASTQFQLADLQDTNNWLGRSQWAQDAFFRGSIGDFRIYSRVLSRTEIVELYADGPSGP